MSLPAARVPDSHDEQPRDDHIVVLRGLRWADWRRLVEARGDQAGPRLAYLDRVLQIMSPSRHHERIKSYLGTLLETWALEVGVDVVPLGAWTLEAEPDEAGLEPDECYQIGEVEKDRPDLAIEVVWTSGGLSKLEIYRRLRVPEVWTWRRGALHVHALRDADGEPTYEEIEASEPFAGFDLQLALSLLDRPTVTQAQRELLAELRRRAHAEEEG
jgi:Uma2 family endonuclease